MKKCKLLIFLASICFLSSCGNNNPGANRPLGYDKYTVSFMLNYRDISATSPTGSYIDSINFLYEQKEINLGEKVAKPESDPFRINYEFKGWYQESDCVNAWDFDNMKATSNLFLYARWGQTSEEEYHEPEYHYPEKIISDANFRLNGVFGKTINKNNEVEIPGGAILRLKNSPNDVKFSLDYERKESVTITEATYTEGTKTIHVGVSSGETYDIKVIDNSADLSMASISSTYENKAQNYEKNLQTAENYHVMLAGSSSMEFWSTYKDDLKGITTYNTGIGGTTVEHWTDKLFERLVLPYAPKCVVYYVGVNNIINGKDDGEACGNKVKALLDKTHQFLPNTKVFYVLINQLPGYSNKTADFDKNNNMVIEYCNGKNWVDVIDAGLPLLKPNGLPNAAYFRTDGLHMSLYGYTLWGNEIRKALISWLG